MLYGQVFYSNKAYENIRLFLSISRKLSIVVNIILFLLSCLFILLSVLSAHLRGLLQVSIRWPSVHHSNSCTAVTNNLHLKSIMPPQPPLALLSIRNSSRLSAAQEFLYGHISVSVMFFSSDILIKPFR